MQALSQEMERLRVERAGEMESTAQVKEALHRTMSASSVIEQRLGQTEIQQEQAKSAVEAAMEASQRAIAQASQLKAEQDKTAEQMGAFLTSQAEEAQKRIQSATQVAVRTQ